MLLTIEPLSEHLYSGYETSVSKEPLDIQVTKVTALHLSIYSGLTSFISISILLKPCIGYLRI